MNKIIYFLLVITSWSCTQNSQTEKKQNKRNKIIDIHSKIKEIEMEEIMISNLSRLFLINDYLIIGDYKTQDKLINIFNKNTFGHILSTAYQGQGPGEIANMGYIGTDAKNHSIFVSDHGKQKIFHYNLDSVFTYKFYEPKVKINMSEKKFLDKYQYINDTLSVALIIEPTGNSGYNQSVAKWNMNTGNITFMKYKHPDITKKRVNIAVCPGKEIYVECYSFYDLMTICDLNGNLIYNIYGPDWNISDTKNKYYNKVQFCKEYIFALYMGDDDLIEDRNRRVKANHPTKFIIFDINGNYIQTLETGYQITDFCYDEENNRIIMGMDDEIQFAYLDLNGILK